jgi:multidrug efflux pump subunit AcrA (membrane-fusion protein)
VTEVVSDALLVPETALRYQGERIFVEAAQPGERDALERDVEIGIVDGSHVQVLRGISEGDVVRVR